ncbi:hypothetical protein D3C80_922720 [compost metagenome]
MGRAHQDHAEGQPHPHHPIVEVLRRAAHAKGVAETAAQQAGSQQMDKPGGLARGFDKIDEQQGQGNILGKVGVHPHGPQHGGIFPVPQRHPAAMAGANGAHAEQHKEQGEQGCVDGHYGHGIWLSSGCVCFDIAWRLNGLPLRVAGLTSEAANGLTHCR